MDLWRRLSIAVGMDDVDRELISLLCTKIGMLMEDCSTLALTVYSQPYAEQKEAIEELAHASTIIANLTAAARSIAE